MKTEESSWCGTEPQWVGVNRMAVASKASSTREVDKSVCGLNKDFIEQSESLRLKIVIHVPIVSLYG